jgi:hypothetical protein
LAFFIILLYLLSISYECSRYVNLILEIRNREMTIVNAANHDRAKAAAGFYVAFGFRFAAASQMGERSLILLCESGIEI